jgi:nucleotide-binding universal stress UspA family protein
VLLLCYDGSDEARHAVVEAARMFPGARSVVLNVWKPIELVGAQYPLVPFTGDSANAAGRSLQSGSEELAREGAELAEAHGLTSKKRPEAMGATLWETVVEASDDLGADVIVTGGRGFSGLHELVEGSLSHRLIQHARRPVLVVPTPPTP